MRHGFIKVAAVVPPVRVADVPFNVGEILRTLDEAEAAGAKIIVFPELCITGYSCGELFLQDTLIRAAEDGLRTIAAHTDGSDSVVLVGMPLQVQGTLYNTAAVIQNGEILAFIPKYQIPNYGEFYELRYFKPGPREAEVYMFDGEEVLFGADVLFDVDAVPGLSIAAELCEDMWMPDAPHVEHALAGATVICDLSASNETVSKDDYRRLMIASASGRCIAGYIYVSSGDGESTQDVVFCGRSAIAENGAFLAMHRSLEDKEYNKGHMIVSEIDVTRLIAERRRTNSFRIRDTHTHVPLTMEVTETALTREIDPHPFIPSDPATRAVRLEEILAIQTRALAKRLSHIGGADAVIGLSGGLDSTLTLLVTARAFDLLGLDRSHILTVTMPCFGTTDRTYTNACRMAEALGTTLREINIRAAVLQHFADIGHDPDDHDVTYENSQARERTQILMDIANKRNAIVVGTGDMSELALGWATYNGDHMSMYGTNAGVPKTLVSHLVRYCAETAEDPVLKEVLFDVLDTPVSPELLPPTKDGTISQKTEDLVGPYELHDFFLFYMMRYGCTPGKILRLACRAFGAEADPAAEAKSGKKKSGTKPVKADESSTKAVYDRETILKWEKTFFRRFFTQQFKRSCLPDGPKVGSVGLSPRGDLRMPSDASMALWMAEIEKLQ